ncbi:MAG: hypothetical protein HWQ35_06350 [Nostoc sp. NMS1]|uniref:hypothetical protein n=1 Tax=unclassified Nostoc TaxID=2593658 RepID=UPI0025EB35EA|nr:MULTISPECIES: hypothetical protein [unclassified Nostoc]MBN3906183.1 hypothetical protein [Nostoc sp. NMS1]MBN3991026.1 hypothetical protein [Nostoc sp. NMS2]
MQQLEAATNLTDISELPYDEVFIAASQFSRFAQLFNISNASTCYEYLQDDEDKEIERWSEFVHIPDPSTGIAHK